MARMTLTPREQDKVLVSLALTVARGRPARSVRRSHSEALALITDFVVECMHGGGSVADLMEAGTNLVPAQDAWTGSPD